MDEVRALEDRKPLPDGKGKAFLVFGSEAWRSFVAFTSSGHVER